MMRSVLSRLSLLGLAFGVVWLTACGAEEPNETAAIVQSLPVDVDSIADADAAADEVRALYRQRDFQSGAYLGATLLDRFPDAQRLRAWTLAHKVRDTGVTTDDDAVEAAVAEADAMVEDAPESPWAWFALANTVRFHEDRDEEALDASVQALERVPDHPDILWTRAAVLNSLDWHDETVAFVDAHADQIDDPSPLYVAKGIAQYHGAEDADGDTWEEVEAAFDAARTAHPDAPSAYYHHGRLLMRERKFDAADSLLRKAVELSPTAAKVYRDYWRASGSRHDLSAEGKQETIEASIDTLLDRRGNSELALFFASQQYDELGNEDRKQELEERILDTHPRTESAEWVLVNRYRAFRSEHDDDLYDDPDAVATYRQMLEDFIDRPQHQRKRLLGDAYRSLFHLVDRDTITVDADELLAIVEGMVEHEGINVHVTHGDGAVALAEHTGYYDRARAIAEEGLEKAAERIEEQREWGAYDDEEEFQDARDWYVGRLRSALGAVYFHEGRLDAAEEELQRAYRMHRENEKNLYRLGQLYEAKDNLAQAETFYREGFAVETMGTNPNEEALETLYRTRHGDLEGFNEYMSTLTNQTQAERKEEVLADRIEDPEPMPDFELETLGETTVTSDAFAGQVLTINMWGKWCGPCVAEMPDVQALHEKYRDDPDVAVLTINNDRDLDDLRVWIEEHEYDFPVLLDDGFLHDEGVSSFPTTWFVGPEGRIEFVKRGYTDGLLEAFSWRIEALRAAVADRR